MEILIVKSQEKIDDVKKIMINQILCNKDFKKIKKGDLGGWINSGFTKVDNSWIDRRSVFTGQMLLNSFFKKSRAHTYCVNNSEISNSEIDGFYVISNCKIKNVKLSIDSYVPIFNASIEKESDLKIINIKSDSVYLNIYPHIKTKEKMVFYGNLDFYIFYTIDNFKKFIKGESTDLKQNEKEYMLEKLQKIDLSHLQEVFM